MSIYHQMGHDSEILVEAPELADYTGVILSPVNAPPARLPDRLDRISRDGLERIFDPQLFVPRSGRENLLDWPYFPNDLESADLADDAWWERLNAELATVVTGLEVDAVCSPAIIPMPFNAEYHAMSRDVCNNLVEELEDEDDIDVLATIILDLGTLATEASVFHTASLWSDVETDRAYVLLYMPDVLVSREYTSSELVKGAALFVRLLRNAGMRVLVGYTASDLVLWRHAGAQAVATGKFWNLRRFDTTRWEDGDGFGIQHSYLFDEGLVAFLLQPDVLRVEATIGLSSGTHTNPFTAGCLERIRSANPWRAVQWRHWLWAAMDLDRRITDGSLQVRPHLRGAQDQWDELVNQDVFMEHPANDGRWLRPWRLGLSDADRRLALT